MLASDRALFVNVLKAWGSDSQVKMMCEECGELIVAIQQYYRGRTSIEDIAEEIADVKIMANQMSLIVGEDLVEKKVREKINRLETRLSKHNEKLN